MQFVSRLLTGEMKEVSSFRVSIIDVRDVALSHLRAMFTPEAAKKGQGKSNSNFL